MVGVLGEEGDDLFAVALGVVEGAAVEADGAAGEGGGACFEVFGEQVVGEYDGGDGDLSRLMKVFADAVGGFEEDFGGVVAPLLLLAANTKIPPPSTTTAVMAAMSNGCAR
ncbi:MAG: hypothetical protein R2755_32660 [Acidimicrobiales bacterium]